MSTNPVNSPIVLKGVKAWLDDGRIIEYRKNKKTGVTWYFYVKYIAKKGKLHKIRCRIQSQYMDRWVKDGFLRKMRRRTENGVIYGRIKNGKDQ